MGRGLEEVAIEQGGAREYFSGHPFLLCLPLLPLYLVLLLYVVVLHSTARPHLLRRDAYYVAHDDGVV